MSEERPPFEPALVLAQVSLRVIVPLVGGVSIGLLADVIGHASPQFTLIGLAGGTLVSILWLRGFIVTNARRIRQASDGAAARGREEHERTTIERTR